MPRNWGLFRVQWSEWDGQFPSSALCLVDEWAQETVSDEREAVSEFSVPSFRDLGEITPFTSGHLGTAGLSKGQFWLCSHFPLP